jgi:hypothetical protein
MLEGEEVLGGVFGVNGGAKVGQWGGEILGRAMREGWGGRERSAPPMAP